MAKTYYEKLRDPRWFHRRDEIIEKSNRECQQCGDFRGKLQVHHKVYIRGREPWEYPDELLECMCERCHKEIELRNDELKIMLATLDDSAIERIIVQARWELRQQLGYEEARDYLEYLANWHPGVGR